MSDRDADAAVQMRLLDLLQQQGKKVPVEDLLRQVHTWICGYEPTYKRERVASALYHLEENGLAESISQINIVMVRATLRGYLYRRMEQLP